MREDLTFTSGGERCAAWLYRPTDAAGDVPCVVMAHGFSLTRHDGLAPYAEALSTAGAAVLVFDHRYLGDSGGTPRQHFRTKAQVQDWRSAIGYARSLPGVDAGRIVSWGFSFSGGHVVTTTAQDERIAAALVLCPFVDGLRRVLANPPSSTARILPRALANVAGRHNTIPVTAQPGELGAMTFPGEAEGFAGSVAEGSPWRNAIAPGVFASVGFHRPVTKAKRLTAPLWVGLCEQDVSVYNRAVERLAAQAPQGELHRYPGDHFAPFADPRLAARIAADQVAFLRDRGLAAPAGAGTA